MPNIWKLLFAFVASVAILPVCCFRVTKPFSTFEFRCIGWCNIPRMVVTPLYLPFTISTPFLDQNISIFVGIGFLFKVWGVTMPSPSCSTERIKNKSTSWPLKRPEERWKIYLVRVYWPRFTLGRVRSALGCCGHQQHVNI